MGKKPDPFGQSKVDAIAQELKLKVLGKLPICPAWAELADNGDFESVPLGRTAVKNSINDKNKYGYIYHTHKIKKNSLSSSDVQL